MSEAQQDSLITEHYNHEVMVEDLALNRDTKFWNVPLGDVQLSHSQLADVVVVQPSFTRFCLTIFEVKVSRSDFLSDIRTDKWRGYLDHSHRFYFATPTGLVHKAEIPPEAGLIVRDPRGWQFQKSAPKREVQVPETTLYALIFLKERSTRRERSIEEVQAIDGNYHTTRRTVEQTQTERVARRFGEGLAQAWADRHNLKQKQERLQSLISGIEDNLREALGTEARYPSWKLTELVWAIRRKAKELRIEEKEATP